MAKEIKNVTLDKAFELLEENYVLSRRKSRWDHKTDLLVHDENVIQILLLNKKVHLLVFGPFGKKIEAECKIIKKEDILCHLKTIRNEIITFHKQRIPKKKNNNSIVDEEDSKLLVYAWLLKKYPKKSDVIVPEISFGERRVDYVAFGDKETCMVEIKSEVDTVERLQKQIDQYKMFANYVYIAIHSSKIKKLDDLDIPSSVGILEISDKLKLVKRATKQKIESCMFIGHLSYNEYKCMPLGLKHSSKFEKEDIQDIFKSYFTTKQKESYSFNNLKGRHKIESDIRKEFHLKGDLKKAVGNTKNIGINRMNSSSNATMTLRSHFDLENEYLISIMSGLQKKFNKIYKKYEYSEIIQDDEMLFRAIVKICNLPSPYIFSKYMRLKFMVDNGNTFIMHKDEVIEYIDNEFKAAVETINETENYFYKSSYSLLSCKHFINLLQSKGIASTLSKATQKGFTTRIDTKLYNDNMRVLVLHHNSHTFYGKTDPIIELKLWELE
ncbi:MAG: hypothetical protein COB67_00440 [SAR324 cluster bacterium]|uniref:Uncharacterized protein n=1 Tax=SAR324 cluster bacterium TaxID=2024889 RepID=A0A2A4TBG6_9DELT|nr:MAG: hypothetical protein COB67_00440 [SAR324 cluster bacterium]